MGSAFVMAATWVGLIALIVSLSPNVLYVVLGLAVVCALAMAAYFMGYGHGHNDCLHTSADRLDREADIWA